MKPKNFKMTTNIYKKEKANKNMKKLLFTIILGIFLIGFVFALDELPTIKQGECITVSQTCSSCSYLNISSISNRENSSLVLNQPMSSIGNGEWRYEFCDTLFLGTYDVRGQGDINTLDDSFAIRFEVTPSGQSGGENTMLYIITIVLLYGLTLLFFFKKIAPMTTLFGMAMVFFGIYMINNGLLVFRDDLTNYLGYLTTFLGGGLGLWALVEWIQDIM